MRLAACAGLAAALLAAPAMAQTYGQSGYPQSGYPQSGYPQSGYPQSGYPQSGNGQTGYGQGYDRQAYPPSTYDRGGYPPSTYDQGRASNYGDTGQQGGAEDPQELARRLNLSGSQRSAYDAYRSAFRPDEARARQEDDDMRRMASLTTPQRLDMARASLARDRADFDRTDQATRAFYAQLSPAQRRTFDQMTAPQMDDGGPDQGGPSPTQPAARPPR